MAVGSTETQEDVNVHAFPVVKDVVNHVKEQGSLKIFYAETAEMGPKNVQRIFVSDGVDGEKPYLRAIMTFSQGSGHELIQVSLDGTEARLKTKTDNSNYNETIVTKDGNKVVFNGLELEGEAKDKHLEEVQSAVADVMHRISLEMPPQ